jgi:hypothetical protein
MIEHLHFALLKACSIPFGTDWNYREQSGFEALATLGSVLTTSNTERSNLFLGGDLLRPYMSLFSGNQCWIVSVENRRLSRPKLLAEVDSGVFGTAEKSVILGLKRTCSAMTLPASSELKARLAIPAVYLTSLTNASRYQTRRYPLNVSRLAQWLRFQHVARVRAVDLALNFEGDIPSLAADIAKNSPDILGVSLNFGELESFRALVSLLRDVYNTRPVLCVGNVLAAWASAEVRHICPGFEVVISASYGESVLEDVCVTFARRASSNVEKTLTSGTLSQLPVPSYPQAVVLPDEQLLVQTVHLGGQASIETSFGCQYGRCSFCPRDHRSKGWRRPAIQDAAAVIGSIASQLVAINGERSSVLSIVDEDAFGSEGLDLRRKPSILLLVEAASSHGVTCEIYTRAEQLFNSRWKQRDSLIRLQQLCDIQPWLGRVFVGIESGSNSQLERYSKGQTRDDVVHALRAGSLLGLPLEFGFITFDPQLSERELVENLRFLARTDVLLSPPKAMNLEEMYSAVMGEGVDFKGDPVFSRVAYMATELELFASSSIASTLKSSHPELIGEYESSFARYRYRYEDRRIGQIAAWCRVWTEGTFRPIYRMRLSSRTGTADSKAYRQVIRRHREATFALLLALASRLSVSSADQLLGLSATADPATKLCLEGNDIAFDQLKQLWRWVISDPPGLAHFEEADFVAERLERRRDT